MSRIGKQLITIPAGVTLKQDGKSLTFTGPKGTLSLTVPDIITVTEDSGALTVTVVDENVKENKSLWGTWASHIKNALTGVSDGFTKELEISGVGYKVAVQGKIVVLTVGYSHPVEFPIPDDLSVEVEKNTIKISGIDKQRVGQIAAEIRSVRKVEPYKGKGIKYVDEQVRRKAGKVAKSSA